MTAGLNLRLQHPGDTLLILHVSEAGDPKYLVSERTRALF